MDDRLCEILCDVFRIPAETFHPQLTSADVPAWDSVLHITLLLTLEQTFNVSFDPAVGAQLTSVPAIKAALLERGVADA